MTTETEQKRKPTRRQLYAQRALAAVSARVDGKAFKSKNAAEYRSFALSFPALVHQCGLAQAVSFADAKKHVDYTADIADTIGITLDTLKTNSREAGALEYMHLTGQVMQAAEWLKRYAESVIPKSDAK